MSVVLRRQQEDFAERLELHEDGTFRYVCRYHVIYGGQYDEDDVTETYTGEYRRHSFGDAPHGVVVLGLRKGLREVSSPNRYDLACHPPELLAFVDRRGDLSELTHAVAPGRGVADERAFYAEQRSAHAGECRCKNNDAHALRR